MLARAAKGCEDPLLCRTAAWGYDPLPRRVSVGCEDVATADLLGKQVRDARLARKLGARKLAKQLGISLTLLREIETGQIVPPPHLVREIADALGLEASELLRAASDQDTAESYLAENAFAGALARRVSEGRVVDDELRRLADAADRLEASRGQAEAPRTIANAEPPSDST